MADIRSVMTDVDMEVHGAWVPFYDGIEFLIARARNPKYVEFLKKELEEYRDIQRANALDPKILEEALLKSRANCILLGWKNIEEDGKPVEYSHEKAMEYFKNPGLKDMYDFVIVSSENRDWYRAKNIKASEGNSLST